MKKRRRILKMMSQSVTLMKAVMKVGKDMKTMKTMMMNCLQDQARRVSRSGIVWGKVF